MSAPLSLPVPEQPEPTGTRTDAKLYAAWLPAKARWHRERGETHVTVSVGTLERLAALLAALLGPEGERP